MHEYHEPECVHLSLHINGDAYKVAGVLSRVDAEKAFEETREMRLIGDCDVQSIMALHGGRATVTSEENGLTEFSLILSAY